MKTKTSKIIAITIALIMIIALSIPTVVKAVGSSADFKGHLAVSSAEGKVGDTVTINVTTTSSMTIENGGLLLEYDKTKLECVGEIQTADISKLDLVSGVVAEGIKLGFNCSASVENVTIPAGTTIATITFKILDGGDQTLKLVYEQEDDHPELATGTVKISVPATGITLDKNTLTLDKGTDGTLVANVTPANTTDAVTWSSDNTTVATVANGKVTAVGNGTATITAKVGSYSASCEVTVHTKLTGIKLNPTSTELYKGKLLAFNVEYEPSDADVMPDGSDIPSTTWESSNTESATFKANHLRGLKQGTTIVTAKVGGFTAQCTIEVKEIPLDSIAIDAPSEFDLLLGYSRQLSVIVSPDNTTDDVSNVIWESDHSDIVSVENGMVKGLKTGEATITATINGKTSQVKITVIEVSIEGIELKADKTTLGEGETAQLYVETNPSAVTEEVNAVYSSSDENVVKVDPETGVMTAVNPGKATITVVVNDKFTKTLEVTVSDEVVVEPEEGENGETGEAGENEVLDSTSPNTGDIAIELFVALMLISAVGITFIVIKNRKNK